MRRVRTLCLLALLGVAAGCKEAPDRLDGGTPPDAATTSADLACFRDPVTHVEIINACTSSQRIDKKPNLPLRRPDGTLPPLP